MTYEEFKDKVARQVSQQVTDYIWFDTDEKKTKQNIASELQNTFNYLKAMADIDTSLHTTVADLLEALDQAGFPKEDVSVIKENKAQILVGNTHFTIHAVSPMHTLIYLGEDLRHTFDLIHTPASILAAYFVERFFSKNWLKQESKRCWTYVEPILARKRKESELYEALSNVKLKVENAIINHEDHEPYHSQFDEAFRAHYRFEHPEEPDDIIEQEALALWRNVVKYGKNERDNVKKAEAAKKYYEEVVRPKREKQKLETIEKKRALLHEYKEAYGVECKFVYVSNYYGWPPHRFVVPAVEGQVVSFFIPKEFDRHFYDNAMRLVEFLNSLTYACGKSRIQGKRLPEDAKKDLDDLLDKLNLHKGWQGIYDESKRHYLNNKRIEEITL